MEKFYLGCLGTKRHISLILNRIPHRTIKSLQDELRWLYNRIMEQKDTGFKWDYAVTSDCDRVFPSQNLNNYWEKEEKTKHVVLPLPHYFFNEWISYTEFISFIESFKRSENFSKKKLRKRFKDL